MADRKSNSELEEIWQEGQKVSANLVKHGEGFSLELGRALKHADPNNSAKVKEAFPEYWNVLWDINDWMEGQKVSACMIKYGGSFVQHLGRAIVSTNVQTQRRIRDTFPKYWQKYLEISEDRDGVKDGE